MKPRKKKSAATECGLSGADAQAAYEQTLAADAKGDAPRAKDLAEHIAGCGPCSSALHVLELQGDAVSTLAGKARDAAGSSATASSENGNSGTAIEGILRVAASSGIGKLADLAYELAKACLIRLPNLERRVRRVVEPREAKVISRELRTVNARQGSVATEVSLSGVPSEAPAEADALRAATSCLKILEQVEGASPRQVLGMSQVHIFQKRPEEAERLLRGLLERPISAEVKQYVRSNLMLALNYQEKFVESVAVGDEGQRQGPMEWMLLFNLAVAHAHLQQPLSFGKVAKQLGKLTTGSNAHYHSRLVRFEIPRLAGDLGCPVVEVERAFGMHRSTRSR